jgi:hypothetical protein
VQGSGYTNHCPKCLWSKHVDNEPGDREALCGGMMEPIGLEGSTDKYRILHKCQKCGKSMYIHIAANDDPEALLALVQKRMP